jgi:TonB family protein
MPGTFRSSAIGAALLTASTAAAQTATPVVDQNWVLTREARGNTVMATAPFSNGITLVARCSNANFELLIAGLPEVPRAQMERPILLLIGDETVERPYQWTVASDSRVAFSRVPAQIARQLAQGGPLQVIVPGEPGAPRTRYVMSLERSGSAIEETLSHCGRPLVEPRDALLEGEASVLPNTLRWIDMPRPVYPDLALQNGIAGTVTLTCLIARDGRPRDCRVESEHPPGSRFGDAALRATRAARLELTEEAVAAGGSLPQGALVFAIRFSLPPRT